MFEGRFFRFKIAGAQYIPDVYEVNLLRQGCPLDEPFNKTKQGSTYWIDFGKSVSANGWMFTTMDLATKTTPVVFSLEACWLNNDDSCTTVGGTEWQHKNDGSLYVSSEREYYLTGAHRDFFFDYSVRYTKNLVETAALVFGLASMLAAPLAAFKVRSGERRMYL
jgi:hypothetical protein